MKNYVYLLIKNQIHGENKSWFDRLFYVGITNDIQNRISSHILEASKRNKNSNIIKSSIINKYGFFPIVLWTTDSREEACEREMFLINWFGRISNKSGQLANITVGGDSQLVEYFRPHEIKEHLIEIENTGVSIRKYARGLNINHHTILKWIKWYGIVNVNPKNVYSLEEINYHILKYEESDISLYKYASENNIEYCNMKKWNKKYGTGKNKSSILSETEINDIINRFRSGESKRSINRSTGICRNSIIRHIRDNHENK
jgi:predicted GIY-YIG superfamily endonuclease